MTELKICPFGGQIKKREVLLFGHGKKTHLFATNKKLTPHLIKTNVHTKNKIKNTQSFNHPTKSTQQPSLATAHRPLRRLSDGKKKDPATGGGRNPPLRPGEREIRPPLVALFVSDEPKKNSGQPTKSFLMPQKSILMPQN
jgi:hypothetical protein